MKRSARRAEDDEDAADGMEVDGEPMFIRREVANGPENLVDDDDLQAALSRARRENAKKKPKLNPEDLAAQSEPSFSGALDPSLMTVVVAQRKAEEEEAAPQENTDEDGRITFDDTSEFVRNVTLESIAKPVKRERAASPAQAEHPVVVKIERGEEGEVDEDEDMSEDEDEALAEMAAREGMSLEEYRQKIDAQMKEMNKIKAEDVQVSQDRPGLGRGSCSDQRLQDPSSSEPVVGNGLAGVLNLLRQQGTLKQVSEEEKERERVQKQSYLWLADFRRRQAKRELERVLARGGNKDQAQREWENKVREQNEARDALELYRNYKPDVDIVYHDEFGRSE
jgi:U4/U6.U5 tri-snRNP-associated protein 1